MVFQKTGTFLAGKGQVHNLGNCKKPCKMQQKTVFKQVNSLFWIVVYIIWQEWDTFEPVIELYLLSSPYKCCIMSVDFKAAFSSCDAYVIYVRSKNANIIQSWVMLSAASYFIFAITWDASLSRIGMRRLKSKLWEMGRNSSRDTYACEV